MWMWSVCGLGPLYGFQPGVVLYALQACLFQMTYMTPRRRAL